MAGGRHVDDTVAFVVAVDAVPLDRGLDLVEVAQTEFLEQVDLLGVAFDPVAHAVGEGRLHNPPLRPLAAPPTSPLSISSTSRDGSRSLASTAVQRPV